MLQCTTGRHKNEDCNPELKTTNPGHRNYFCLTHQQWISDFCSSGTLIYTFDDGTTDTFETYLNDQGFRKIRQITTD